MSNDDKRAAPARCPVCVFTAANVTAAMLRGFKCWNCGGDLGDHDVEVSSLVAPSKAYAMDRDAIRPRAEYAADQDAARSARRSETPEPD